MKTPYFMKNVRQSVKSVAEISVFQMTIKLVFLAGFFLVASVCLLLGVKHILDILN